MDNYYIDPIQGKDEESNLDAEFIKVDKESVCSDKSSPSTDLLEAHEKVQQLEHELVSVSRAFKISESEVTRLNHQVSFTNKKLQQSEKNHDELEISNKKLHQRVSEAEEELRVQETKQKAINDVQEAYDDLQLELESSKKKMLEVNQEILISEGQALRFEELHRQSGVHAEMEMKKALEFERLLEMAKLSAVEVENQMATLQGELMGLYEKIAENEKLEEALRVTTAELSAIQGELKLSKSQIVDLEKRLELQEDSVNKVALLDSELSSLAAEKSELQLQLKSAMEKEEVLNESLNGTTEEKINMADALNNTTEKLVEAENSLQLLQNELKLTHQKLGSTESNLEAAGMREIEVLEKLKLAEELLEKHRDSEVRLQEVIANFNSKDFEVQALEEQVMIYKEQTMEAAERSASLKEEFAQIALKLANSESANEELKKRVLHAEDQATQSFSEIDMLVETNTQLKSKINELQELLNSEYTEKEETSQKLSSHLSTIMELNDRHSRASELADSHKIDLEQTLTRLKELENAIKELENRSSHFEKECEGLARVGSADDYYLTGLCSTRRYLVILASSVLIITWLNLSNDVYDFDTGADINNKESVVNLVGSRTGTLIAAYLLLVLGFMGLAWASLEVGSMRSILLLASAITCGYIYQCPPFRLSYHGLGETLCFAAFGPFATTAFYLLQGSTRELPVSGTILCASLLVGFTTTLILFCSH